MRYRYLRDPLFLFSTALYFVNRWILKPYFPNEFSRGYLNDMICIPLWVPVMLFMMKKARLRREDSPPSASEILIPLLLWSWLFEAFLPFAPFFRHLATSDYLDILSYTIGACFAAVFWKLWYRSRRPFFREFMMSCRSTVAPRLHSPRPADSNDSAPTVRNSAFELQDGNRGEALAKSASRLLWILLSR